MRLNKQIIIGLTGGSGCGKTTVAKILKEQGAYIIDADKIAHKIMEKGQDAYYEIIENFKVLDEEGNIDRKKLGKIVFSDKKKLELLNLITHKHIIKQINDEINLAKSLNLHKYIVLDAPLLIETNLHKISDVVWIVYVEEEERIERLMERDGIKREDVKKRINMQTPFEKIKSFADFIIYNKENINLKEIILNQLERY